MSANPPAPLAPAAASSSDAADAGRLSVSASLESDVSSLLGIPLNDASNLVSRSMDLLGLALRRRSPKGRESGDGGERNLTQLTRSERRRSWRPARVPSSSSSSSSRSPTSGGGARRSVQKTLFEFGGGKGGGGNKSGRSKASAPASATDTRISDRFATKRRRPTGSRECSDAIDLTGDAVVDESPVREKKRDADEAGCIDVDADAADVPFEKEKSTPAKKKPKTKAEEIAETNAPKLQPSSGASGAVKKPNSSRRRPRPGSIPESFDLTPLDLLSTSFDARTVANSYSDANLDFPPFSHLCDALKAVCGTTKRLAKQRALTNILLAFLYHDRSREMHAVGGLDEGGPESVGSGDPAGRLKGESGSSGASKGLRPTSSRKCDSSATLSAVLLAGNSASDGLTLNIGHAAISAAVCSALSCSKTLLRQKSGDAGEMGDAAAEIFDGGGGGGDGVGGGGGGGGGGGKSKQTRLSWGRRPSPLSVRDLLDCLTSIHEMNTSHSETKGVEKRRRDALAKPLSSVRTKEEMRFAVKVFCGNIRTGATLTTLMTCLANAHVLAERGMSALSEEEASLAGLSTAEGANPSAEQDGPDARPQGAKDSFVTLPLKEALKKAQDEFRLIHSRHCDLRPCVTSFVSGGFDLLRKECKAMVGVPLMPMLAAPCRGVEEVLEHFQGFVPEDHHHDGMGEGEGGRGGEGTLTITAEYKYDGQRVQVHVDGKGKGAAAVTLFSRNLEDVTSKFASFVEMFASFMRENGPLPRHFILDAEICAVKRPARNEEPGPASAGDETGPTERTVILPFQVLSTMKRDETDMAPSASDQSVGLCVFAYDLLLLDGRELVDEPLSERRRLLRSAFEKFVAPARFEFARSIDFQLTKRNENGDDDDDDAKSSLESFLMESIGPEGRCEGLMVKSLRSTYDGISRERGGGHGSWRKLKRDYVDGLADTIDVVPIGAWRGSGRKKEWFSPFLLGVLDPATGEWQSLCRCMSGFTDECYQQLYDRLSPLVLDQKPEDVSTDESAPFWFDPRQVKEVWEIRGADLTLSPVHHAARGMADLESSRGIALRFPRFIRTRDDKDVDQASTCGDVLSLFASQAQRQGGA